MKKLINNANDVVSEMLEGIVRMSPDLTLLSDQTVVLDQASAALRQSGQVALISGGGAGHEPAHAGYVGAGMLSAAVSGDVFTSPSVNAILAAIRAVAGPGGVLLLVKSYTGDRLNFGLAAELARSEGIAADMVVIGDDVSLPSGPDAGRRGIAGTVFVHKIAGAAASAGLSLADVKAEALAAASDVGTMGVGLSACTVPAAGRPGFELGDIEIELGLGIHGEAGVARTPLQAADRLVDLMLEKIVADRNIRPGERVALLVNNLGGTPTMEMYIVARRALAYLAEENIEVERAWCGSFLTALEMAGCSLSLMRVDDLRLARLDAATHASAWPSSGSGKVSAATGADATVSPVSLKPASMQPTAEAEAVRRVVFAVCGALKAAQDHLTDLDRVVGDGDIGISLARGAAAIESEFSGYDTRSAAAILRGMSATVRRAVGGTSGPLYAVFLLRGAAALEAREATDIAAWGSAFKEGCQGISELGGAAEGDRTMLDALIPAARALAGSGLTRDVLLHRMVEAAENGRDKTAQMMPRRGRSSYMGARAMGHVDPGAAAAVIWLAALQRALA
ncbi:MAG: dihydroxyacetone kinase, DhaK subunit [Bradyrhizobium sp.]|nr:dihydroxyacetone kinase, DhaK subunit [Bradyrhizobium sp.]